MNQCFRKYPGNVWRKAMARNLEDFIETERTEAVVAAFMLELANFLVVALVCYVLDEAHFRSKPEWQGLWVGNPYQ